MIMYVDEKKKDERKREKEYERVLLYDKRSSGHAWKENSKFETVFSPTAYARRSTPVSRTRAVFDENRR